MSTYQPNIPATNDYLDESQPEIQANFAVANTVMGVNHLPFDNLTADKGKHKFLQMPEQASDPATLANEGAFYTKVGTNPAESNLFYRAEDSAGSGGQVYQLTRADQTNYSLFGTNTTYIADHNGGWTFLPGGLILMYGIRTSPPTSGTITFPFSFPSGNPPFMINLTTEVTAAGNNAVSLRSGTATASSVGYIFGGIATSGVNWTAIGN